jgi:MFS family permease
MPKQKGDIKTLITSLSIGGLTFGALCAGFAGHLGRWPAILGVGVVSIIGCGLTTFYTSLTVLCIGKFLQGAAAGGYNVFCPKFINECSPKEYTGPLGACF